MALALKINPQIPSEATVHCSVSIEDATRDSESWTLTVTLVDNFGNPYGVPQRFTVLSDGSTVTNKQTGAVVTWLQGKEPSGKNAGNMAAALLVVQDILTAIKNASADGFNVTPRA